MAVAIDPVCLMEVDTDNPPGGHSEYGGLTTTSAGQGARWLSTGTRSTCFPARAWCPWSTATTGMEKRGLPAEAESLGGCEGFSAARASRIDELAPSDGQVLPVTPSPLLGCLGRGGILFQQALWHFNVYVSDDYVGSKHVGLYLVAAML